MSVNLSLDFNSNSLYVGPHGTIYLQENMILAIRKSATAQSSLGGVGFANAYRISIKERKNLK